MFGAVLSSKSSTSRTKISSMGTSSSIYLASVISWCDLFVLICCHLFEFFWGNPSDLLEKLTRDVVEGNAGELAGWSGVPLPHPLVTEDSTWP